jgi:hypothetical protein
LRAQELAHVEFYDKASLDYRFIQDPDGLEQEIARARSTHRTRTGASYSRCLSVCISDIFY